MSNLSTVACWLHLSTLDGTTHTPRVPAPGTLAKPYMHTLNGTTVTGVASSASASASTEASRMSLQPGRRHGKGCVRVCGQ